jgi:DNA-directed RNA polymerase specialized sigma24 family protein
VDPLAADALLASLYADYYRWSVTKLRSWMSVNRRLDYSLAEDLTQEAFLDLRRGLLSGTLTEIQQPKAILSRALRWRWGKWVKHQRQLLRDAQRCESLDALLDGDGDEAPDWPCLWTNTESSALAIIEIQEKMDLLSHGFRRALLKSALTVLKPGTKERNTADALATRARRLVAEREREEVAA